MTMVRYIRSLSPVTKISKLLKHQGDTMKNSYDAKKATSKINSID